MFSIASTLLKLINPSGNHLQNTVHKCIDRLAFAAKIESCAFAFASVDSTTELLKECYDYADYEKALSAWDRME